MQTSNGGSAYGASGKYGNSAAVGQTANGDKYATANGNTYKNTGSGWTGNSNNTQKYWQLKLLGRSKSSASGWGGQEKSSGSSAFSGGGGGGWESKSASARGSASSGGGGRR